jgi:hypothetical protein
MNVRELLERTGHYVAGGDHDNMVRDALAELAARQEPESPYREDVAVLDAAKRVVMAVTVQGPSPRAHREAIQELRREWPTLHHAVTRLVGVWQSQGR